MNIVEILVDLVIGGVSGWLAGMIMKSEGSLIRNIILGLLGGVVGGVVFSLLGFAAGGPIARIIVSVIGACILVVLANKFLK